MEQFKENPQPFDDNFETKPTFDRKNIPPNEISEQIRGYVAHVKQVAEETGQSIEEVVRSEKEAVKQAGGVKKFLEGLNS